MVNHHGQHAKLVLQGRVQSYIEEVRQLQTMVRGWLEEALIGTFLDGLKPRLAMRMAEIFDQSYCVEKRRVEENVENEIAKTSQTKTVGKNEEMVGSFNREKVREYKKLSMKDFQERIKKGLCFKCGRPGARSTDARLGRCL